MYMYMYLFKVILAHNTVALTAEDRYSARLVTPSESNLTVASGTVFNEILLWHMEGEGEEEGEREGVGEREGEVEGKGKGEGEGVAEEEEEREGEGEKCNSTFVKGKRVKVRLSLLGHEVR